jgi:MOSC domain-containing protein YiiM
VDARIVSVNVGRPRKLEALGRTTRTSIFKDPVDGAVAVRAEGLDGDRQADLRVHGGPTKAVYGYPVEHYPLWAAEMPEEPLPWGALGENLSLEGLREAEVFVGDVYRVGSAELRVTEPRLPCFKLVMKFRRESMIPRMLETRRTGFYFGVVREGRVRAGDAIELVSRDPARLTIDDVVRLTATDPDDVETLRRALACETLPEGWKTKFRRRLEELS